MENNKLKLNQDKTELLIASGHNSRDLVDCPAPNESALPQKEKISSVEVLLDQSLSLFPKVTQRPETSVFLSACPGYSDFSNVLYLGFYLVWEL